MQLFTGHLLQGQIGLFSSLAPAGRQLLQGNTVICVHGASESTEKDRKMKKFFIKITSMLFKKKPQFNLAEKVNSCESTYFPLQEKNSVPGTRWIRPRSLDIYSFDMEESDSERLEMSHEKKKEMSHESECSESWERRERGGRVSYSVCRFPCIKMSMLRKGGWELTQLVQRGSVAEAGGQVYCFSQSSAEARKAFPRLKSEWL